MEQLVHKVKAKGFSLDSSYHFFLSWHIDKQIQHTIFLEKEDLEFQFSTIQLSWESLKGNFLCVGDDVLSSDVFFEKFNIDPSRDKIIIQHIYSLKEMINNFESYVILDKNLSKGFIQIGVLSEPQHGRLIYALNKEFHGSIWLELPDENFIIKVGDNILSVLAHSQLVLQTGNIERFGGTLDKVKKRFGEDFWRLEE